MDANWGIWMKWMKMDYGRIWLSLQWVPSPPQSLGFWFILTLSPDIVFSLMISLDTTSLFVRANTSKVYCAGPAITTWWNLCHDMSSFLSFWTQKLSQKYLCLSYLALSHPDQHFSWRSRQPAYNSSTAFANAKTGVWRSVRPSRGARERQWSCHGMVWYGMVWYGMVWSCHPNQQWAHVWSTASNRRQGHANVICYRVCFVATWKWYQFRLWITDLKVSVLFWGLCRGHL